MISWDRFSKADPTLPRYGTDFTTRESRTFEIAPSSRHLEFRKDCRKLTKRKICNLQSEIRNDIGAPAGIRTPNQQIMSLLL